MEEVLCFCVFLLVVIVGCYSSRQKFHNAFLSNIWLSGGAVGFWRVL
ncbi:hypothetical protein HY772_00360 [Candidatus Woesearchaeota archaeon]|nr:hypothetical protein [Candidatus Woesearchaeota archaeon]